MEVTDQKRERVTKQTIDKITQATPVWCVEILQIVSKALKPRTADLVENKPSGMVNEAVSYNSSDIM